MGEESQIGLLISNIVDNNHYSHCRLCLEHIGDGQFSRFTDTVAYSPSEKGIPLVSVLCKVLGEEVADIIPGVDAICNECLNKTLEMYIFIEQFETSTMKLHNILDNLNNTLNVDIDTNQQMYIICNNEESKLIIIEKGEDNVIPVKETHKCKSCKEDFNNVEEFVAHNKTHHELYTCLKCTYSSNNEADVMSHEESSVFFKCDQCSQYRCTENSLKEHEDKTHCTYMCVECGKSYKGLDKLLAHEEKHIVKKECPKCGKSYITKLFYEKHVKLCLEDNIDPHPIRSRAERPYVCKECGQKYRTAGGLKVHERFTHGNAKPHICKECGKRFTAPCYLRAHKVTHTKEKNFPCDICDRKFVTKEALLSHVRRHTGEKPYFCDQCGERFVNASARADHIRFKHIGPTLSCDFCPKKFVTKIILKNHMKKHHNPLNKLYVGRADVPHNIYAKQSFEIAEQTA